MTAEPQTICFRHSTQLVGVGPESGARGACCPLCEQERTELAEALRCALALFENNHALSRFDWGTSALRAQDIHELNVTPGIIRAALKKAGLL